MTDRGHLSESGAERALATALRGRKGTLTRADAVALTGLPTDVTDAALRKLLSTYESHLAVTDEGELLYRFDPRMVRRDAVPARERIAQAGRALWKAFTIGFKVWIVATLIFYVAAFVAMAVALVVAQSSNRDDRRRSDGGGFGFPWIVWWMMPDWAPPQERRRLGRRAGGKRFYRSVFDFVFGPGGPPVDRLEADRAVVGYLRTSDGRITATDLVALTGWSYDRAEREATRLLADYDGEPEVTPEGTIVYSFPSLRRTAGETEAAPFRYAWQEEHALAPFTGNSHGTDAAIAVMNGFNLVAALSIAPAFLARFGIDGTGAELAATWFPLAFSSLFFGVPAGRWAVRRRATRRAEAARARAAVVREIVVGRGAPAKPEALCEAAAAKAGVAPEAARRALEQLLRDLDGDVTTSADGSMEYAFPRVGEELEAVARARALAPTSEIGPGTVVFSSDDSPAPAALPQGPLPN